MGPQTAMVSVLDSLQDMTKEITIITFLITQQDQNTKKLLLTTVLEKTVLENKVIQLISFQLVQNQQEIDS